MKKKDGIKSLFALSREAVLGVRGKKILFANPAAELAVGMNPEGMPADKLLPDYLLENEAESFVCTLEIAGKPFTASVSSYDGVRLVCLSGSGSSGDILPALASNVTTVMRSSLGTMRAALDQMGKQLQDSADPGTADYMGILYQNYYRLYRTTHQLAIVGAVPGAPVKKKVSDCVALWTKLVDTVCHFAEARGVQIRFTCEARYLLVPGEQDELNELLLNLLANSLGTGCGEIDLDLRQVGKNAILTLRDTGGGMEPEVLSTAFIRFEQALSSGELSMGAGMGLHVTKSIVERCGGALIIESRPQAGTRVVVQLPVEENPGVHTPEPIRPNMHLVLRELSAYLHSADYSEKYLGD